MRIISRSLVAGILTLTAVSAQPQNSALTMDLGGFSLSLGMTQEEALRKLAIVYDVRAIDNAPGHWNVLRKGGPP
jgi:hypothetical protein